MAQHGWEHFRALERQVVTQVAYGPARSGCRGGTLIDAENARLLKTHGVVVLLVCELYLAAPSGPWQQSPFLNWSRLGWAAVELAEICGQHGGMAIMP